MVEFRVMLSEGTKSCTKPYLSMNLFLHAQYEWQFHISQWLLFCDHSILCNFLFPKTALFGKKDRDLFIYLFNLSREVELSVPDPKKTEWSDSERRQHSAQLQPQQKCCSSAVLIPGPKHPIPGPKHPIPGPKNRTKKHPIPGPKIDILNSFPILAS